MELPLFQHHGDCRACPLAERAKRRGLRTRAASGLTAPQHSKALVFVGAAPAADEERTGVVYCGPAGTHLNGTYIRGHSLNKLADCYLTNACRCFPRGRSGVDPVEIMACRQWLLEDLELLRAQYEEVVLVACGSEGIHALLGRNCSIGTFPQGHPQQLGDHQYTCFATYQPAILLPNRDPAKLPAIKDHLMLVRRWLRTGRLHDPVELPRQLYGPSVPDPPANCGIISLDIETYGCVERQPVQRCFQPTHSVALDGVKPSQLVQTVGLAWKQNGVVRTKLYRMCIADDRRRLLAALKRQRKLRLLSNNVQFDVVNLRYFDEEFRRVISREAGCELIDLMVYSFLENDARPERSLKSFVVLFGIADYYDEPVDLRKGQRYRSVYDGRLHLYNCKDAVCTLLCLDAVLDGIADRYGAGSPKLSAETRTWYSEALWLAVTMSEQGVMYDIPALEMIRERLQRTLDRLWQWGAPRDLLMCNVGKTTGSKTSQQKLVDELVRKYAPKTGPAKRNFDQQLLLTEKKGDVSTKDVNLTLLRAQVPRGTAARAVDNEYFEKVVRLQRFRRLFKLQTSYVHPLLGLSPDNIESQHINGVVHPRWHIIPSRWAENTPETGRQREGGQRQARFSAQDPPIATQPDFISACQRSRFKDGATLSCDLSQIELRVPVIYSGDPVMLALFVQGVSLHAKTATELCGRPIDKKKDPVWYDAGKHANFLRVYGGGAPKLQQTILLLTHQNIPLGELEAWIDADRQRYPVFYAWQESLYVEAQTKHRLSLPLTGLHRTFLGDVRKTYRSEILNFPVQGLAAMLAQSAQFAVDRELRRHRARTVTYSNVYDAGYYDCPADEVAEVEKLVLKWFKKPPLYDWLLEHGYAACPLDAEVKIRYNTLAA